MSGDTIQSKVTADLSLGVRAVQKLKTEFSALGVVVRKVQDGTRKLAQGLRKDLSGKNVNQAGQALGKAGGKGGAFSSQILGGAAGQGGFARLAVGAGLASLAFKAFSMVIEAGLDRVRKLIEAEKALNNVRTTAQKELDSHAKAGESQAGDQRLLLALGGDLAKRLADAVTGTGVVERGAAAKGVQRVFQEAPEDHRLATIVLANEFAQLGVDFNRAIDMILAGPGVAHPDAGNATARRIARSELGFTGTDSDVDRQMDAARGRVRGDRFVEANRRARITDSEIGEIERDRSAERSEELAREALIRTKAPEAVLMGQLFKAQQEQLGELQRLATEQGKVMGFMSNIFRPEGSFETQMRRLVNAQAGAQFAPGG